MSERIKRVCEQMKDREINQLIVSDPVSIAYLTGIDYQPSERMYVLLITQEGDSTFFLNRLFNIKQDEIKEIWFTDTDDYVGLLADQILSHKAQADREVIGVDKVWPARFLLPLEERLHRENPGIGIVLGSDCVDFCRARKDEDEREKMRRASVINDMVIEKAKGMIKPGITEKELAAFIDAEYLKAGCEGNAFKTIVAFGANAADPHHMSDDSMLEEGSSVVIDMGCKKDGYCSDMTRTFFVGEPEDRKREIYQLVLRANEEAERMIRPGMPIHLLDDCARGIITEGGYGPCFTHRLGHFIGRETHEKGDVSAANTELTAPGMVFSIEPGIYVQGYFGVRIEDLVLITEDGCEILNHVSKEITVL